GDEPRCRVRVVLERDDPDLELLLLWGMRGIRLERALPVGIVVAAPREDDVLAVARDGEMRELLSIVRAIVGELPRLEVRPRGGPDVPHAEPVEHPRDARAGGRRGDLLRVRVAEHLL